MQEINFSSSILCSSDTGKEMVVPKTYDSVRGEVLYNILIEFGIPMKLVRQISKIFSKVHISRHLPDSYFIQNDQETRRCFITIAFQESQGRWELNGTHHLLVYADVRILGKNIITIEKIREVLLEANKMLA
jgi:hypothetical protein